MKKDEGKKSRAFSEEASAAIMTAVAYNKSPKKQQELLDGLPEGTSLLSYSDDIPGANINEFRAAIFINSKTKELFVAIAGTRPGFDSKGRADLMDDIRLVFNEAPKKALGAANLNDFLTKNLGDAISEYKINYTGHSLGAAMAHIAVADMAIKMRKSKTHTPRALSAIGFDNPGAKRIIQEMYEKAGLAPNSYRSDCEYISFNNKKNIVNSLNAEAGDVFHIVNEKVTWAELFLNFVETCCGNTVANFISRFLPDKLHQTAAGHGLENFKNTLHEGKGVFLKAAEKELREFKSRPKDFIGQVKMVTKRISGFLKELMSATIVAYDKETFERLKTGKRLAAKDIGRQEYVISSGTEEIRFSAIEANKYLPHKVSELKKAMAPDKPKKSFVEKEKKGGKKESVLLDPAAIITVGQGIGV